MEWLNIVRALGAIAVFVGSTAFAASPTTRPNVVLILADDMGYSDLGCFGSEIKTPNIDSIGKAGVTFTQFYNQARCCPTRATLMTGRWPHQVGIGAMIDGYAAKQRAAANSPAYDDHLSTASPTIPELLRPAGYQTLMSGKWHLGYRWAEWPFARGFDRSFALIGGAMNYYGPGPGERVIMAEDDKPYTPPREGFYSTDAFTDHAISQIETATRTPDKPFFLYLAYNAPHWPLQAPEADVKKYSGVYDRGFQAARVDRFKRMKELGIVPTDAAMAPMDRGQVKGWDAMTADERTQWARRMEVYAAQVDHLDGQVGRVLATLDKLGVADNTLVIFLSDNGGAAEDPNGGDKSAPIGSRESFRGYARPWATVSNTPWRMHKVSPYEGGVSTPLLARWPAGIPKTAVGMLVRTPGHVIDLMPTLLDVANTPYPTKPNGPSPEGRSLLPVFRGEPDTGHPAYYWEHENNRGLRDAQWKLVSMRGDKAWHLFDVAVDRTESRDVSMEQPEVVKELAAKYDAWAKRVGVALPN